MNSTPLSLLERLRQPDPSAAWTRFTALYTPLIYYWVRRRGLQQADAEDVVQDVFVTLVEKLPAFQYAAARSFRSWLRTVTLNQIRAWSQAGARPGRRRSARRPGRRQRRPLLGLEKGTQLFSAEKGAASQ